MEGTFSFSVVRPLLLLEVPMIQDTYIFFTLPPSNQLTYMKEYIHSNEKYFVFFFSLLYIVFIDVNLLFILFMIYLQYSVLPPVLGKTER